MSDLVPVQGLAEGSLLLVRRMTAAPTAKAAVPLAAAAVGPAAVQTITLSNPAAVTQGTFSIAGGGLSRLSQLSSPGGSTRNFVATYFTADETRNYVFGQTSAPTDTVMILYNGDFDPTRPGVNAVVLNDDTYSGRPPGVVPSGCGGSASLCPQVSANLTAGQVVTLVVTTYSANRPLGLPQTFYADGPGRLSAAPPVAANRPPTGSVVVNSPDGSGQVTGSAQVSDPDADPLTFVASTPGKGVVTVNADGTFSYVPTPQARHAAAADGAAGAVLADAFDITVSDGRGGTLVLPVAVAVAPANTAPGGSASAGAPDGDGRVVGSVSLSDPEADPLTLTAGAPGQGVVTLNADGTFSYVPTAQARHAAAADGAAGAVLADAFEITVSDGHG
ncbi:MAG: Ig-like domain-containing protein, partial [Mycobacterium sp.]